MTRRSARPNVKDKERRRTKQSKRWTPQDKRKASETRQHKDKLLDAALEATFPSSDPVAISDDDGQ